MLGENKLNDLAELLNPWSPQRRASAQAGARQCVEQLVRDYGAREAKRIWEAAAVAIPKKRGRPPGARDKEDGFDPWRALQCLYAFAHFPENADLTRWQVIRMAAEAIADAGGAGAIPEKLPTAPKQQVASAAGIKVVRTKQRKAKVDAMHKRLEREQSLIDRQRQHERAVHEIVYGDGPQSVASFMPPEERAQKLEEACRDADQRLPALPQLGGPSAGSRTKKPAV